LSLFNSDLQSILVRTTYPERLQILKTESLELRRLKFDLNMIYCAIHVLNALDSSKCLDMCYSNSRGHSLKIRNISVG